MPKTIKNDVSHITLNITFESYINKTFVAAIFAFSAFPAKYLQGCPPRLCSWVYVEMISTGQPFTARHAPQTLLAPWVYGQHPTALVSAHITPRLMRDISVSAHIAH